MLGRASRWSIHGQRALLAFCELMIAVAANFDDQPEIRAALEAEQGGRDNVAAGASRSASAKLLGEPRSNATTVPFYIRPAMIGQAPAEQVAAAIRGRAA